MKAFQILIAPLLLLNLACLNATGGVLLSGSPSTHGGCLKRSAKHYIACKKDHAEDFRNIERDQKSGLLSGFRTAEFPHRSVQALARQHPVVQEEQLRSLCRSVHSPPAAS